MNACSLLVKPELPKCIPPSSRRIGTWTLGSGRSQTKTWMYSPDMKYVNPYRLTYLCQPIFLNLRIHVLVYLTWWIYFYKPIMVNQEQDKSLSRAKLIIFILYFELKSIGAKL